jgi:hypothetical protein
MTADDVLLDFFSRVIAHFGSLESSHQEIDLSSVELEQRLD